MVFPQVYSFFLADSFQFSFRSAHFIYRLPYYPRLSIFNRVSNLIDLGDITLLVNTPAQVETLLHSLERAAGGIGLHVNADKTEYMSFNQTGDISTLNSGYLKLVDKFTYVGSSVSSTAKAWTTLDRLSSTETLAKAWTTLDRLSVISKSDLTDKIKRSFFQAAMMLMLPY